MKKFSFDSDCYLTTACINHYYEIAPQIVENINTLEDKDLIYNYIYEYIIKICVQAINHEDYEFIYTRYKNNILRLEK